MMIDVLGLLVLASAACACAACTKTNTDPPPVPAPVASAPPPVMETPPAPPGSMSARPAIARVRGPSLSPTSGLVAWLDKQVTASGQPRLVRLPVILTRGQLGFTGHAARVGGAADALAIDVNDAMLGVALADRARNACSDRPTCALWLEGYWRGKAPSGDAHAFDVKYVGDAIGTDELSSATFAEVAAGDDGSKK